MKKILVLLLFISNLCFAQTYDDIFSSVPLQAEYNALLVAWQTNNIVAPSRQVQILQNKFIYDQKQIGTWNLTDMLKVYATDGAIRSTDYNWINPALYVSVQSKTINFTRNEAIAGNAVDGYIDTGWNPSANGVHYTQNSAETITYFVNQPLGTFTDGGRSSATASGTVITPWNSANTAIYTANSNAITAVDPQLDGSDGVYMFGRINSTTTFIKKNSGTRITNTNSSSVPSTKNYFIGALNDASSINHYSNRECSLIWQGGLLTTTQEAQFLQAWNDYYKGVNRLPQLPQLGIFYNKTSFTSTDLTNDFTNIGSTVSVVSGGLQFTGGSSTFTQCLRTNRQTSLDLWKETYDITVGAKTSATFGWSIGLKTTNTHSVQDIAAQFVMSSGGTSGQTVIYTSASGTYTSRTTSATNLSFSIGDHIIESVERNKMTFTVKVYNGTTDPMGLTTITTSYTYPFSTTPTLPNTSGFSIYPMGGAANVFMVNGLKLESNEFKNLKWAAVGDSKTSLYRASYYNGAWPTLVENYITHGARIGGGGDTTGDLLNRLQEVIDLAPTEVILLIGSNDPRYSISSATTIANYDNIVSTLVAAGIRVVHCTGFYETSGVDQTPLQAHIIATYSSADIIDTLPTTITLNADGIHPDDGGMLTEATIIITSLKW